MLRITRHTDYGIVLLSLMAQSEDVQFTARGLAEATHLPLPMVGKILSGLARAGLLDSQRGKKGGYCLSRAADSLSVAEIIVALEGPIGLTACSTDNGMECEQEATCRMQAIWARINTAIRSALEGVSLADISQARAAASSCSTNPTPAP